MKYRKPKYGLQGSVLPALLIIVSTAFPQASSTDNMALIPGASFEMGQDKADLPKLKEKFNIKRAELFEEEIPKHRETIGSFYIDRTEVTNAQFKRFIEQNREWQKSRIDAGPTNGAYLQNWNGNNFPVGQENHPVVFVTWYAAVAYCESLGKRLPTEAEWEFAARGGLEGKVFPWGDEMPDTTRANFAIGGLKRPTAVGSYPANGYGLFDMAGNVWEFLADEFRKYDASARNGSVPVGGFAGEAYRTVKTRRALRGGSYGGAPVNLRVTYRDSHSPENAVEHVGFRCAMTNPVQSDAVNELLRRHHALRALADSEREFAAFTVKEGFRDGFIKYFAEDGIGFGPDPERTREKLMKQPPATGPRRVIFNWAPMFGDISAAGDLGYTTGPVLYTDVGENPRPPRHGIYFSVWQKQADGSWKVAVDMGVPVPSAVAPVETKFTAARPVVHSRSIKMAGDYRKLDAELPGSISKDEDSKAYLGLLDEQFRFHRPGMMPVTDRAQLSNVLSAASRFEFIDGKIASSGDLAFTYGKYSTANAETQQETGYYVHVWRRDAAGRWRLVADVQNPLPKQ